MSKSDNSNLGCVGILILIATVVATGTLSKDIKKLNSEVDNLRSRIVKLEQENQTYIRILKQFE